MSDCVQILPEPIYVLAGTVSQYKQLPFAGDYLQPRTDREEDTCEV